MTLIMNYINSHPELFHNMTVKYSLVTEYFDQIVNMKQFPIVETGSDYFPYFDNSLSYWTGFYTSRPTLKKLARESESIARSAELLLSLVKNKSLNTYNQMYSLRSVCTTTTYYLLLCDNNSFNTPISGKWIFTAS